MKNPASSKEFKEISQLIEELRQGQNASGLKALVSKFVKLVPE